MHSLPTSIVIAVCFSAYGLKKGSISLSGTILLLEGPCAAVASQRDADKMYTIDFLQTTENFNRLQFCIYSAFSSYKEPA
jgi:hypothetical protein